MTSHRLVLSAIAVAGLLICLQIAGCGREGGAPYASRSASDAENYAVPAAEMATPAEQGLSSLLVAQNAQNTDAGDGQSVAQERKIIYTTSVDLVVDDYSEFERKIVALVQQHGGFVSQSHTDRRSGDEQNGTWTIRVPVDQYAPFLQGVTTLGYADSRREQAQDVTEEFVDLQARIANKEELEKRVIKMLDERTGKLTDVLEIERELARIREEIERMEGRLRYLADHTSLATITINCREQQHYTPPAAPTLASRIQRSWGGSVGSLLATGENVLVGAVAATPWVLTLGIPALLITAGYRRRRR